MLKEDNLHDYQKKGVDHILNINNCGLFLEMGMGKTTTTLTAINKLMYEEIDIHKPLVIGPKRVVESVWHIEGSKWDHLKHLKFSRIIGNEKNRIAAINRDADIYLISRDNIAWLCGLFGGSMLPFDMLVIDESSSFKNHKSQRFKALRKTLLSFKRVVILTGTPAPNSLIDLWPQIYLLDRGERLFKFITTYREQFFNKSYNGFSYDIRGGAEQEIYNRISDVCMSMKAEDYLKLPGRKDNYIKLQMPPKLKKQYDDFERESVLELYDEGTEISVANAAALSNKLLQFANGAVYDDNKNWTEIHTLKIDALKDIVEEAQGKPVLVAYAFKHGQARILKALSAYKPVQLKTNKHIEDWNNGKIRVMVMHPASGGHGLNLQHGGNILVWFGQTWSLELYQQFNARLDRQGQKHLTIIHHLIVDGTIDTRVVNSLKNKDKGQKGLMNAIKASRDKYIESFQK